MKTYPANEPPTAWLFNDPQDASWWFVYRDIGHGPYPSLGAVLVDFQRIVEGNGKPPAPSGRGGGEGEGKP